MPKIMVKTADLKVFISTRDATCDECDENLGRKAWITLTKTGEALCLSCADLDHLIFLPSGDAALTRRSRKYSTLSAVVLKWTRARKRYERQGLLVESRALEQAEQDCLADNEARALRRDRASVRREGLDRKYVKQFSARIQELYPGCPAGAEVTIAEHACLKYSGRIGRSAAAKEFKNEAVKLAVIAHIRHVETKYDELLAKGYDRWKARDQVKASIETVLSKWGENLDV
jgi:hypothetical protein